MIYAKLTEMSLRLLAPLGWNEPVIPYIIRLGWPDTWYGGIRAVCSYCQILNVYSLEFTKSYLLV